MDTKNATVVLNRLISYFKQEQLLKFQKQVKIQNFRSIRLFCLFFVGCNSHNKYEAYLGCAHRIFLQFISGLIPMKTYIRPFLPKSIEIFQQFYSFANS